MPGKLDEISEAIGGLRAAVKEVIRRQDQSDQTVERHHRDNQDGIGMLRHDMQASMSELRDVSTRRYEETTQAVAELTQAVETIRPQLTAIQMNRGKLAILASIGFLALTVMVWAIEAGVQWLVTHALGLKFGG